MTEFIKNAIDDYMNPWGDYSRNNFITMMYIIHALIVFSFIAYTNYKIVPDSMYLILFEIVLYTVLIVLSFMSRDYDSLIITFFSLVIFIFFSFLAGYNLKLNFYIPKSMYTYLELFSIFILLLHLFYSYKILDRIKNYYPRVGPYFVYLIGIMLVILSKNLYFFSHEGEVDFKLWLSWTLFTYLLLLSFYLTLDNVKSYRIENYMFNRIAIINFFIWLSALIPAVIYINSSFLEFDSYIPQLVLENQQSVITYTNIILGFLLVYFLVDSVESLIAPYLNPDVNAGFINFGLLNDRSKLYFVLMMLVAGYICMNIFYGSEYLSYRSTLQLSIYLVYGILFTILLRYFYNIRVLGIYFVLSMILFNNLDVNFANLEIKTFAWDYFFHDFTDGKAGLELLVGFILNIFWNLIAAVLYIVLFGWVVDIIAIISYNFSIILYNLVFLELFYGVLIFILVYVIRFTILSNNRHIAILQRSIATIVIVFLAVQLSTGYYSQFLSQLNFLEIKQEQTMNDMIEPSNISIKDTTECTYYNVINVRKLNVRDKPEKPSNIVGVLNNGESVCIYDFSGKWGRTDRGWVSGKYLSKS